MFKRLAVACALALALIGHAFAAGSIQLSGSQQFDSQGRPLSGGLFYTFQSGTTTPQSAFQDQALTIPYPNPITLDASGRIPFFYLADGNIKIRLTDATGVTVIAADGLLVIGPSSGGGGGGGVDPTTILQTGDVKVRYGTGTLSGFVRLNGRTLGSASSGATERANADAQALFEYLWASDPNLTVSGGRGVSPNADWLANKTITLPDMRGRAIAGLDNMGGTSAGRLTSTWFGATATVLGAAGGGEFNQLTNGNQLAAHNHTGSVDVAGSTSNGGLYTPSGAVSAPGALTGTRTENFVIGTPGAGQANSTLSVAVTASQQTGSDGSVVTPTAPTFTGNLTGDPFTHSFNVTPALSINNTGASAGFRTMAPAMVMTIYQKL